MGTRRGNGEAEIVQLPSGSWRTQVMVAGRRHSVTGRTKEEAKRKRRELLSNADKGILPSGRQTLAKYMEWWLEDVVKPSRPASTYRIYEQLTRLYIVPVLGRVALAKLEPAHVRTFHAKMQSRVPPR